MLTFRSFITKKSFARLLLGRLKRAVELADQVKQVRLYSILKFWICDFWFEDFEGEDEFCRELLLSAEVAQGTNPIYQKIAAAITSRQLGSFPGQGEESPRLSLHSRKSSKESLSGEKSSRSSSGSFLFGRIFDGLFSSSSRGNGKHSKEPQPGIEERVYAFLEDSKRQSSILVSLDEDLLVQHFCLIEQEFLFSAGWQDFLRAYCTCESTASLKPSPTPPPSITAITEHFNEMTRWIVSQVLTPKSFDQRSAVLSALIRIAFVAFSIVCTCACVEVPGHGQLQHPHADCPDPAEFGSGPCKDTGNASGVASPPPPRHHHI